jgi:DNA-binding PadR family transcriptional regulator
MRMLEYHLLLSVWGGPLHGYGMSAAVARESLGGVAPTPGACYRAVRRLVERGLLVESQPQGDADPHPGRPRRYYELTPAGRATVADETERRQKVLARASARLDRTGLQR